MAKRSRLLAAAIFLTAISLIGTAWVQAAPPGGKKGSPNERSYSQQNHRNHLDWRHREDVERLAERTAYLRKEHGEHRWKFRSLRKQVAGHEDRIAVLEVRIAEVTGDMQALSDAINGLADQQAVLMGDVETNASAIASLEAQVAELSGQLAAAEQELQALYAEVAAEVQTVKSDLAAFQAQVEATNTEVQAQIDDLQAQVQALNDTIQNSGVTLEDLAQLTADMSGLLVQIVTLQVATSTNSLDIIGLQQSVAGMDPLNHVHLVKYKDLFCTGSACTNQNRSTLSETGQLP